MKLIVFVALACIISTAFAVARPQQLDGITSTFKCLLCKDVCKDTESWEGEEEQSHEAAQIAKCMKLLGNSMIAKLVCEDFVKNELDAIIQHMEDPNTETSDCNKTCTDLKFCK